MDKWIEKTGLVATILGVGIGAAGLGYSVYSTLPKTPIVSPSSRFYCEKQATPETGGEVWTVMYRHDRGPHPWLKMVRAMGSGWDQENRCKEIAKRLDSYRKDKLLELSYRADPNTPKQYVICAKTKLSADVCPLVLTLLPKDDPYTELQKVFGALLPGSLPSYQCNDSQNCPPPKPLTISLTAYLTDSDR